MMTINIAIPNYSNLLAVLWIKGQYVWIGSIARGPQFTKRVLGEQGKAKAAAWNAMTEKRKETGPRIPDLSEGAAKGATTVDWEKIYHAEDTVCYLNEKDLSHLETNIRRNLYLRIWEISGNIQGRQRRMGRVETTLWWITWS